MRKASCLSNRSDHAGRQPVVVRVGLHPRASGLSISFLNMQEYAVIVMRMVPGRKIVDLTGGEIRGRPFGVVSQDPDEGNGKDLGRRTQARARRRRGDRHGYSKRSNTV